MAVKKKPKKGAAKQNDVVFIAILFIIKRFFRCLDGWPSVSAAIAEL